MKRFDQVGLHGLVEPTAEGIERQSSHYRAQRHKGLLSALDIAKLDSVGFDWKGSDKELTLEEKIAKGLREIDRYIANHRHTIAQNEKSIWEWEKKRKALENREPDALARLY